MSDGTFLSRWSRRKAASKATSAAGAAGATADVVPAKAGTQSPQPTGTGAPAAPIPLPPVESLTPDSDFTPFLQEHVGEDVRRAALKTLFNDPRFNVMDGLDVYIDDYSKPDPLPAGWLEKLNQVGRLGEYRDPEEKTAEGEARPEGAQEGSQAVKPPDTPGEENPQSAALTPDSSGVNSGEIER